MRNGEIPLLFVLLVLVAGTVGAMPPDPNVIADGRATTVSVDSIATSDKGEQVIAPLAPDVQSVLMQALSLIGVNYRFGGNSIERGFDCSGFVRHVFAEAIALDLPRNSYAMSRLGKQVDKDQLEPGDLLFYNTLRRQFSHVAIYLGEGRFVHAPSKGKQVEIVDMSDSYWKKRFNGARRLLRAD